MWRVEQNLIFCCKKLNGRYNDKKGVFMKILAAVICLAVVLTACAGMDQNRNMRFSAPEDAAGKQCTVQCRIAQNGCVQLAIEHAKQFVIGPDKTQYSLYLDRTGCDREYRECYQGCGGQVSMR